MPFVVFPHFGINVERWTFLGFVYNGLKVNGNQPHLQFELPKIEILSFEFVNDYALTLK
jgi:hypothetical protein